MKKLSQEYNRRLSEVITENDTLIRVPDLDSANYLALISNHKSGHVYYFIDDKEILTSVDVQLLFSKLSKRIIQTAAPSTPNIQLIARLFLLIYKGRKALIVEQLEECALLEQGRISTAQFSSPFLKMKKTTLMYNFWTYEIHKNLIANWVLTINHDGTFKYTLEEFPPLNNWDSVQNKISAVD